MANHTREYCAIANAVAARDGWCCQYCGSTTAAHFVVEHVIPEARGGHSAPYNLVVACASCNNRKRNRVWIPQNIALLIALNPEWGAAIRALAAAEPPRQPAHPAKTYRIDPDIAARLKAWAALHKRTEQAMVEELIGEFLARVGG